MKEIIKQLKNLIIEMETHEGDINELEGKMANWAIADQLDCLASKLRAETNENLDHGIKERLKEYEARPVVHDYGIFKDGELILICENYRKNNKILEVIRQDIIEHLAVNKQ